MNSGVRSKSAAIGFVVLLLLLETSAAQNADIGDREPSASPVANEKYLPKTGPLREREDERETARLKRFLSADHGCLLVSGEIREQYESWRGREFGLIPDANNDYLLQRIYLNFDYRPTDWLQLQVELGSSLQFGSSYEPAPIDEDPFYFQQLWFSLDLLESSDAKVSAILGRQTFSLGSGRLVAVRNGPNVRRSFEAARLRFENDGVETQLIFGADATFGGGAFDNEIRDDRLLWGHYHTFKPGPHSLLPGNGGLDLYYLGFRNAEARFDSVSGEERRHSFGARAFGLFGTGNAWDYNFESVLQFGSIAEQQIYAWTIASLLGRSFPDVILSPRLGLKFDVISGDENRMDDRLGTFNAYFPNNSYFSEAAIFAPANLLDLNLNLDLQLTDRISAVILWDFLWRYSTADAIFVPPGIPSVSGNASAARTIGNTLSLAAEWRPIPSLESSIAYVHLDAGQAVTDAGGGDSDFVLLWATMFF